MSAVLKPEVRLEPLTEARLDPWLYALGVRYQY